jgi:hypothetical protein
MTMQDSGAATSVTNTDAGGAAGSGALSCDQLDAISGGTPKGYHECVLGTKAGGGPGLYPLYVACRMN